ncbi:MAG: aminotransferase class I/II-fold pyridoxal phosphate-dependent enzyme [Candidatus Krumholzibacteriia bacterium]
MRIEPFALERFFARHEFTARWLLSCSDAEPLTLAELLAVADAESRRLWETQSLGYTETAGHPLLREAVAGTYRGLAAADVLVLAPQEGIFLLVQALLTPGDHVVVTRPAYQSLHAVAQAVGCEVTFWEPEEADGPDGRWRFDPDRLADLLRPGTRLVIANFPHNPTGAVPSHDEFARMAALCGEHGARLFCDEIYRDLELVPGTMLPAACEVDASAVSLGGLSKSYGLPGLRIGWLATRDHAVLERVALLRDYTTICSAAPAEVLALAALSARDEILTRQHSRVLANLALLERFIAARPGLLAWRRPVGGSVCFPRLTVAGGAHAFCERMVGEAGIMLAPSTLFGRGDQHVRFGFGRTSLPAALERFGAYLDGRPGRASTGDPI